MGREAQQIDAGDEWDYQASRLSFGQIFQYILFLGSTIELSVSFQA